MYIPNTVPKGHTETLQLTVIPQVLACYILYKHIYSTDIYSPNGWQHISNTKYNIFINVHSQPCVRRAYRNPPTYSHPPSVGMIYPISTNINKLRVHECVRLTSELYCVV